MPDYKYDYLVFIGRFQPFHSGHVHVAREALKLAERLIFIIGSHDRPRDLRNPFTTDERISIIKHVLEDGKHGIFNDRRLFFAPQVDYTYNDDRWIAAIQSSVEAVVRNTFPGAWSKGHSPRVGIVGYSKDHSSFYLKKFPQWPVTEIMPVNALGATELRIGLFGGPCDNYLDYFVDGYHLGAVEDIVKKFPEVLKREYKFQLMHDAAWAGSPYEPTFNTVDAVVTQGGHLLVGTRKSAPGEGQWCMPGGYLKAKEKKTLLDSVIDEIREETKLTVPTPALIGSIVKTKTYDDPYRSNRGRIITTAYHFKLNDGFEMPRPKVKGDDDLKKAQWITFSEFANSRSKFFEDHFCIISDMLGI
jgi:bifunctional NMN adenylyltransferase/nudix hydrolase